MTVSYYTKDIPGSISYDKIEISRSWHCTLYNVTWEYGNVEVQLPKITLGNPLWDLYYGTAMPVETSKGQLFYKKNLLLDSICGEIFFTNKNKTLTLFKKSQIHCSIVENGTKTFLNHGVIPPFSAEKVTLTLEKGSIDTTNTKHQQLSGNLALHTLDCTENHLLSVILKMLKREPQARIPVSCGDIHFIMENGIAAFRKTPFLVDQDYTILSKGTVNFNQATLNISVGLVADSIKKAFDIQYLPDGYIIPFTIDGSISNPKYHTKNAIASIAAIILLKKISPESRTFPKTQPF